MCSAVVTTMSLTRACAMGDSPSTGASCVKIPGAGRGCTGLPKHAPGPWHCYLEGWVAQPLKLDGPLGWGLLWAWFRGLGVCAKSLHTKAIKWLIGGINTVSSPDIDSINPITLAQITLWSYLMTSMMNDYDCFYSNALSQIHFWLPSNTHWVSTGFTFHCVLRMGYLAPISLTSSASLFVYHLSVHIFCNTNSSKLLGHFLKAG